MAVKPHTVNFEIVPWLTLVAAGDFPQRLIASVAALDRLFPLVRRQLRLAAELLVLALEGRIGIWNTSNTHLSLFDARRFTAATILNSLMLSKGLLTVYKVARKFEFISLQQTVHL